MVNDETDQIQVTTRVYEDLDIGGEQVSSKECWDVDEDVEPDSLEYAEPESAIHADLDLGNEQVTSNECYDVEEE